MPLVPPFTVVYVDPSEVLGGFFRYSPESIHSLHPKIEGDFLDAVPDPDPREIERDYVVSSLLALIEKPVDIKKPAWTSF